MGRPRKIAVVARMEPSRPALVEAAPLRPELDELGFRLAVVDRIGGTSFETLLIDAAIQLPHVTGAVREQTIEKCLRLLGMLKEARS